MSETRHTFVLRPHRSLGAGAFLCLMVFYGGVSFVAGLYFLSLGAWPVCGFFGLDVLLLYLAFRANYRSAHLCETIEIDAAELVVTTRDVRGRTMRTTLNPYWLRVQLVEFAASSRGDHPPQTGPCGASYAAIAGAHLAREPNGKRDAFAS